MFQNTHRLLTFINLAENIRGRKKLQKIIHLLTSAGTDFPFRYRYHHYGPYSSQLQFEMDQLVEQGYINEKLINGAYDYSITEKGKEFRQRLKDEANYAFEINEKLFNQLIDRETPFLEMFSTYVFLREKGDSEEEARQTAAQLKPKLTFYLDEAARSYETYIVH